jgi:hypothetical protein
MVRGHSRARSFRIPKDSFSFYRGSNHVCVRSSEWKGSRGEPPALYGLAIEFQNGWMGHNGNIFSYMVYPYYLPADGITMVVMLNTGANIPASWQMMQNIARIVSPNNPWTNLPKE